MAAINPAKLYSTVWGLSMSVVKPIRVELLARAKNGRIEFPLQESSLKISRQIINFRQLIVQMAYSDLQNMLDHADKPEQIKYIQDGVAFSHKKLDEAIEFHRGLFAEIQLWKKTKKPFPRAFESVEFV